MKAHGRGGVISRIAYVCRSRKDLSGWPAHPHIQCDSVLPLPLLFWSQTLANILRFLMPEYWFFCSPWKDWKKDHKTYLSRGSKIEWDERKNCVLFVQTRQLIAQTCDTVLRASSKSAIGKFLLIVHVAQLAALVAKKFFQNVNKLVKWKLIFSGLLSYLDPSEFYTNNASNLKTEL